MCPSTGEWIKKIWSIYKLLHHPAIEIKCCHSQDMSGTITYYVKTNKKRESGMYLIQLSLYFAQYGSHEELLKFKLIITK